MIRSNILISRLASVGSLYLISLYLLVLLKKPSEEVITTLLLVHVTFMALGSAIVGLVAAHETQYGVKRYLRLFGKMLALEIPNILQIVTFLGFVSFLLGEESSRAGVALVVTGLLIVFIRNKTADFVNEEERKQKQKISAQPFRYFTTCFALVMAGVVYFISGLPINK